MTVEPRAVPTPTREELIVDAFWECEGRMDYETALKMTADKFSMTCAEVEKLIIEDDALNAGNG